MSHIALRKEVLVKLISLSRSLEDSTALQSKFHTVSNGCMPTDNHRPLRSVLVSAMQVAARYLPYPNSF
jgi:hypothetical protein